MGCPNLLKFRIKEKKVRDSHTEVKKKTKS